MAGSLGTLTLDLIARIGGYTGPLDQATRASRRSASEMSRNFKAIGTAAAGVGLAAGGVFAVLVKNSIDVQDELSKTSQKIGVSVEDLSILRFSAESAGVGFEELSGALGKFSKNISDTYTKGVGAAADAFADLGIALVDSAGNLKSTNAIFSEVAGRLATLDNGAIKTSISMDLFGKSGKDLIPLLNLGAKGLSDSADEAARLGQVFSTDAALAAEQFNDNLERLQKSISGVANTVAMEAVPQLAELTNIFADPQIQEGISRVAKGLLEIATQSVKALAAFGDFATYIGESVAAGLNGVGGDDIVRLEAQLDDLKEGLDPDFFSFEIALDTTVAKQQIAETEKKIADYYARASELAKQQSKIVAPVAAPVAEADPFALTASQIKANAELRESNKQRAIEAANFAKQLQQSFESTRDSLRAEVELHGVTSKAALLSYEIQKGALKGISEAHKEELLALARKQDQNEKSLALAESTKEAEANRVQNIAAIVDALKDEQSQLTLTADAYLAMQLKAKGANENEVSDALARAANIREIKKSTQELQTTQQQAAEYTQQIWERVDETASNVWVNILSGAKNSFKGIQDIFKKTIAEMAHQAVTKPITLRLQQSLTGVAAGQAGGASGSSGGGASAGASALGGLGIYAVAAVAVVAAVGIWNKKQDEKFVKMTAEYKQGNQSLVKVLGEGNRKSQSINSGIELLKTVNGDVLNVNYSMLAALLDIRAGIGNVAAGFAKTLVGGADYRALGISEGTVALSSKQAAVTGLGNPIDFESITKGTGTELDGLVGEFLNSIGDSINKAIYNQKSKVIDSGIEILGNSLADILEGATLEAFSYADVKTTKKVFGINAGSKVKRATEELSDTFQKQLTGVFENAGQALQQASGAFGLDFEKYVNDLQIKTQDLSLKGLTGDALAKEIESFFGATLDNWADVLLGGTTVLFDFQKIGESAFDTMLRLSSQTNTFADYAKTLNLNFQATGLAAVYAAQNIAELAGGFEGLGASLSEYYNSFFDSNEKFLKNQEAISKAFSDIGFALPKTRDQFKELIGGLNLLTESGQEQFTALIKLSGATDKYITSLEAETKAKEDEAKAREEAARQSVNDAFGDFNRTITRDMDKVKDALNGSKQVADSLSSALKGMRLQSVANDLQTRKQAQAQLSAANAAVRAGGALPGVGQLDEALAVLSGSSVDLFSSFEEYSRDFYIAQKSIKELGDAAGVQVGIDEQNLAALQSALDFYQTEIDILNGIDSGILSVADAMANLTAVLAGTGGVARPLPVFPTLSADYENTQDQRQQSLAQGTEYVTINDAVAILKELHNSLNVSQRIIITNTMKTEKVLNRWDIDGMPEQREVAS